MRAIKKIETKNNQLTPGMIGELDHYLDYLINKMLVRKPKRLKQNRAGGLKDILMTSFYKTLYDIMLRFSKNTAVLLRDSSRSLT